MISLASYISHNIVGKNMCLSLLILLCILICNARAFDNAKQHRKPTNILMILADDLGWGDTSVYPFVGNGVRTPHLEAMAAKGTVLKNFHSAAAVCTPTRASILTGMNPWRIGIKGVYEYGKKGSSNRDDWMPLIPTVAGAFKAANYSTLHSGKWHVGGMRNDDHNLRVLSAIGKSTGTEPGGRRCPHPGPNQQGFSEYVSVLDGPGAPRQNKLQVRPILYSQGCGSLLHNDKPLGADGGFPNGQNPSGDKSTMTLSDCEAGHAVRMMQESVQQGKPFFLQLWFHAPHGPWEYLPGYEHLYPAPTTPLSEWPRCDRDSLARYCAQSQQQKDCKLKSCEPVLVAKDRGTGDRMSQYRSMISSMDKAIGYTLRALHDLGIERDTLVVFTSDNGPEMDSGCVSLHKLKENPWPAWKNWPQLYTTAGLRGNKRFIYEGGLKVPTIVQWVGTIPKGRISDLFAYSADLAPTFLQAAGIPVPSNMRFDGVSILSELIGGSHFTPTEGHMRNQSHSHNAAHSKNHAVDASTLHETRDANINAGSGMSRMLLERFKELSKKGSEPVEVATAEPTVSPTAKPTAHPTANPNQQSLSTNVFEPRSAPPTTIYDLSDLRAARKLTRKLLAERVVFWHGDFEGPRSTAARALDFKLILDAHEAPFEMFDLRADPRETNNLLNAFTSAELSSISDGDHLRWLRRRLRLPITEENVGILLTDIETNRNNIREAKMVHLLMFSKLHASLRDYALHGNAGHVHYLAQNEGRLYTPTAASDNRHGSREYRLSDADMRRQKDDLMAGACSTPCSCDRHASDEATLPPLPVDKLGALQYLMPSWPYGFVNITSLLIS